MFSKPLAFVVLALACLTAAAGGAYIATRRNLSEAAVTSTRTAAPGQAALAAPSGSQPAAPPSQAVAETEAAVTTPRTAPSAPPAAEAAPEPVHTAASSPAKPSHAEAAPAARPSPRPAAPVTAEAAPLSRPPQRTVPMTDAGAPVSPQAPPSGAPQPPPVTPGPSASMKPADPVKPAEEPQPEAPKAPQFEELILPASSVIGLQVETTMTSERARVEDRIDARVSRDVMSAGRVAIPAGSRVIGSVTIVERGGKMKEQARLGIRFHTLVLADGTQVALHTDTVYRLGEDPTASSSKKIGGAAIGGAILGAILGGGKGAAIGGAAGAGAGSAAVMAGDRNPATLRQGEYLNVKLATPATITVERREE
jgi:type IV secretory pathway VirB10-like protein